ncbi:hypothetical protein [Halomarina oriensis]|uniref:DUF8156 domain-containing protein n=1 Tax=Halomarina oriensis TaxID=671145 RepID=A0A6B0GRI8_9EURY|nr:hypothetical protein [Halomarina oriensis]MWG36249.1 hypothetical protein [Halomarina oriensis]
MGRTNLTFRDLLRGVEDRWADFRRALRRDDQFVLDRLFEYAHEHADAGSYLNHRSPLMPVFVSIDLEQEKRIDELEGRLDDIEDDLNR